MDPHTGTHQVKMTAEISTMCLQPKEFQTLPVTPRKLREKLGAGSPSQPLEGTSSADTLASTSSIRNCRNVTFCRLSCPACGLWGSSPSESTHVSRGLVGSDMAAS